MYTDGAHEVKKYLGALDGVVACVVVCQRCVLHSGRRRITRPNENIAVLVESSHGSIQIYIVLHFAVAHGSIDHRSVDRREPKQRTLVPIAHSNLLPQHQQLCVAANMASFFILLA